MKAGRQDTALQALYSAIDGGGLLLADEQCVELPCGHEGLQVLSNRVDVARRFEAAGFDTRLNDFEFSDENIPQTIYYRVSKEKALVHYLINEALARLPLGGRLLLAGDKGDGIKTYGDKARVLVGAEKDIRKGAGGSILAVIRKQVEPTSRLDDSDYRSLQDIAVEEPPVLFSKPGVYGWKKIDRGSALLIEALQGYLEHQSAPTSVLDLGCGYGYLSVMAARCLPGARIVATDNNIAAVCACERNFQHYAIDGEVRAADCAEGIQESFDLVLCNPPFHKGFDIHGDLTQAFLSAAAERLKAGGSALFVVNQFIGLEQRAQAFFRESRLLTEGGGFKVFLLR